MVVEATDTVCDTRGPTHRQGFRNISPYAGRETREIKSLSVLSLRHLRSNSPIHRCALFYAQIFEAVAKPAERLRDLFSAECTGSGLA